MRFRTIALHLGLFVATCISALIAQGWQFALCLMSILVAHEMGHFLVALRRGVSASLPYFIPIPPPLSPIGTLGAIIRMPPVRDRNALFDIGAAGPIAGLCVAIPILAYGLSTSPVLPQSPGGLLEGGSLLYLALKLAVFGEALPTAGRDVYLNGVAFAGWVGLLVTFINLLPIGQLDGGHIAYAYYGKGHNRASAHFHKALIPVGLCVWAYVAWEAHVNGVAGHVWYGLQASSSWFVWFLLLPIMRRGAGTWHPPAGEEPLSPARRRAAFLLLAIFVLIFVPIPMRFVPVPGGPA